MNMKDRVKELEERRARIKQMGGEEKVRKQHDRGKWSARERMDRFFDDGKWFEVGIHGTQMGQFGPDQPVQFPPGEDCHVDQSCSFMSSAQNCTRPSF